MKARLNLWLVVSCLCCAGSLVAADRPNIVVIMADDMGLGDTSAYQDFTGNSDHDQLHTPAMQRLANMGVRFTDAHTPSSRCSPTRYGLLTGRYPWRNRLKHWVLFGAQGDPMIERDRPTIATLLKDQGYTTGMVGKWHIGLRYRQSNGMPADGWNDADLTQPLFDTPLDHGFDFCRFTSRSHGTSGPEPGRRNKPDQTIGPGHIHGRAAVGATSNGRQIAGEGDKAYVLSELGGRHACNAVTFLDGHFRSDERDQPFFLYYACNSNHSPYTPDSDVFGSPVAGAARNVAGEPLDARGDFIYENDVALGGLLNYLESHDDPRTVGHKLIDNTIVIFTSDNGAEQDRQTATGPFRSNKGSVYEGGHRVPFVVAWPDGGIGDGNAETPGKTSDELVGHTDVFATLADVLGAELPDVAAGEKGAEDSVSVLPTWKSLPQPSRPMFFNDHKQADDPAACAMRFDDPVVAGRTYSGEWKLFFDASLLRMGTVSPRELFNLTTDSEEANNRLDEADLAPLVEFLSVQALLHRTSGGHRLARIALPERVTIDFPEAADQFHEQPGSGVSVETDSVKLTISVAGPNDTANATFDVNPRGLGVASGAFKQVDDGEALLITVDRDVIVESVGIVAGNGVCGGFYRVGDNAPLAIYCLDADIDGKDQSGVLSDIGVLRAGETLRLDSGPHYGVEARGRWRLQSVSVRMLQR